MFQSILITGISQGFFIASRKKKKKKTKTKGAKIKPNQP